MLFGTKFLPIISNEDPIIGKLIRLAYLEELEGKGAMHRITSVTMGSKIQTTSRECVGKDFQARPFSLVSIDPLGLISCHPTKGSRNTVKLYPLMMVCRSTQIYLKEG